MSGITVLCASCRLLVDAPGVAYTEASIFKAAWGLGWTVVGRQCFCPTCRPAKAAAPAAGSEQDSREDG